MMLIEGDPDYADQVPRRSAYEADHPNVEIIYLGSCWQAIIHEHSDGLTVITRYHLKALLDKLDTLT